jgi:hypothetical protein
VELARRTGPFPQLVDSRSGVNRVRFATISPNLLYASAGFVVSHRKLMHARERIRQPFAAVGR